MHKLWWLLILGVVAAGCSGGDSGQEPAAAIAEPEAPAETVFDPMVGTIDRAKSVDGLAADRMDELNQQLEESE
jgi:hypothetical protein